MKTFLFNSEFEVYAAMAETREEAIELIKVEINRINDEYWNDPLLSEAVKEHRKKTYWIHPENFDDTVIEKGYGFQGNFVLEPGKAIVYGHGNE